MSDLTRTTTAQTTRQIQSSAASGLLQRKCACGQHTTPGGDCAECAKKKSGLQRKLAIGASNDPLEREADRVADQVMAAPARSVVGGAPPRIQRFSGQSNEPMETAPASVDRVLSGTGRPLDSALRQDMEQRFGRDFSRVRVHSGAAAEYSARQVSASAYTVGHNIVFGAGRFAQATHAGRRLIAHELTHVVQQSGLDGIRLDQSDDKRSLPSIISPLLRREPTKPRASTGKASITDLTTQTAGTSADKATAGSLSRQEWESLFRRHFSEPDQIEDEVESSQARYLYSNIYGWIDAQHFFAHIQFAEEMGLQGATDKGIAIEEKQAFVRNTIGPDPDDTTIYSDLLEHNLINPDDFLHYRETLFMAISAGMDTLLSKQEKALLKGFSDEKLAKVILDNAMSAWSYEDLVSNQLGVQFFRLHGAYVNAGKDAVEVRQRFINKMTEYFATLQVIDDPATIKAKGAKLPGKERWTSPKMSEAQARKKFPELFEFGAVTHRIRIAVYDTQSRAEKGKDDVVKVVSTARGLYVAPYGQDSYALYSGAFSHYEAMLLKWAIDHAILTGAGGALVEPQPTEQPAK